MIAFEANNVVFCILDNPKCGSSLLRKYVYPQILNKYKVLFKSGSNIHQSGYDSIRYVHCNLEGCICFLQKKNIDVENVVFITTIRNPVQRVLSNYYYVRHKQQKETGHGDALHKDISSFIDWPHLHQFFPEKFRCYQDYRVTEILKLENIREDFTELAKKYNLDIDTSMLDRVVNGNSHSSVELPDEILERIRTDYELDFVDGNYPRV